jgi:hypothetical protein
LLALPTRSGELFDDGRLVGTVGYYNGEAAFLLVPFWVSVYVAGSRRVNVFLRAAVLAGAVLSLNLAIMTQSRGAMVAMAVSLLVFFIFLRPAPARTASPPTAGGSALPRFSRS